MPVHVRARDRVCARARELVGECVCTHARCHVCTNGKAYVVARRLGVNTVNKKKHAAHARVLLAAGRQHTEAVTKISDLAMPTSDTQRKQRVKRSVAYISSPVCCC